MNTQTTKILILGGGFAGVMAALRLAGKTRKEQVQITLVSASDQLVERTRMHQLATGQQLKSYPIPHLLRKTGVQFVCGKVTALQPNQHCVTIEQVDGQKQLEYDKLVYALGSFVDRASMPGAAENAFTLDLASAEQLRTQLPEIAQRNGRVVVIGAGLTGLEVVTEVAESYPTLQVSLLCGGTLGRDFAPKAVDYVHTVLRKRSISLHEQSKVTRIDPGMVDCADGSQVPFDLCIYCGGFAVSPLAREAGIAVNLQGQMLLDGTLRSLSHPDIYGAGDASTLAENVFNLRMACATALPMAAHVADSLAAEVKGHAPQPFRFGFTIRCVSLGRSEGFVQMVDAQDRPKPTVLTGRLGVWIKEFILRFVIGSIQLTRLWPDTYQWPRSIQAGEASKGLEWQFSNNR
ncbi:MAG: FAD-dependent oxidoreductase [Caldilineaceae bacterium]